VEEILGGIQTVIARALYGPAILLSLFATASIVPNAMEKGSIDLLLSKPLSRLEILTGKLLGGILIVLINIAYYIVGMWLIIAITTGFWNAGLLWCIFPITFAFVVLFSLSILIGVTARSSALAIILTYFLFILIVPVLTAREMLLFRFIQDTTVQSVITGLYYLLPKTDDLANACATLITAHRLDWMPVWTSALFACAMFAAAAFAFRKKDF
jgi:ABC-type transport system involved in multi-copper enzyme maturation permease subunit